MPGSIRFVSTNCAAGMLSKYRERNQKRGKDAKGELRKRGNIKRDILRKYLYQAIHEELEQTELDP